MITIAGGVYREAASSRTGMTYSGRRAEQLSLS